MTMLIDGSFGEGGGQILRTSLALSILTKTPIQLTNIRAGRKKPGLLRQHLTGVRAAAEISGAQLFGAELGAKTIVFDPGRVKGGAYTFRIGSAGSVGLVLQTVLFPLLFADEPSELVLEGGTHNPMSPPFDFLTKTFFPILQSMGAEVSIVLEKPGFYPAGGGRYRVHITPATALLVLDLNTRGEHRTTLARALVANLPMSIAERELTQIRKVMKLDKTQVKAEAVENSDGPGNAVLIELVFDSITEVVSAFGERGLPAEKVARTAAAEAQRYLERDVPVGEHLADQLLIPMALGAGGTFRTTTLTEHTVTNMDVIARFIDVEITHRSVSDGVVEVRVDDGRAAH